MATSREYLAFMLDQLSGLDGETVRSVADFCCFSFLGITLEFIWNRMEADVDKLVGRMNTAFDGLIESIRTVPDRAASSGASLAAAT